MVEGEPNSAMTLKVLTIKYRISKKNKLLSITRKVFSIQMRFLLLADINEMVSGRHCHGFTRAKFRSAHRPARQEREIEAAQLLHISRVPMDSSKHCHNTIV